MKLDDNLAYTLMESPSWMNPPDHTADLEILAASLQVSSYLSFIINQSIAKGELHESYSVGPAFIDPITRYYHGEYGVNKKNGFVIYGMSTLVTWMQVKPY